MTVVHQPPPAPPSFAGIADMKSLIALIENKNEAKKFLSDYEKLLARHKSLIAAHGSLNKIEAARDDAEALREKTATELEQAKKTTFDARATAKDLVHAAENKVAELEAAFAEKVTAWDKRRTDLETEHHTAMTDLARRERALAKMENDARILLEKAEQQEARLNEQIEKFRTAGLL